MRVFVCDDTPRTQIRVKRAVGHLTRMAVLLTASFLVLACASIRPAHKIGLLAPFEGLERRTGYDALAAIRAALVEAAPAGVDLLPAALDVSQDVRRASRKLIANGKTRRGEQTLAAVIGPFTPQAAYTISDVVAAAHIFWVLPFARTREGFSSLAVPAWAAELLTPLAEAAQSRGARRLILAGWTPGWPPPHSPVWAELAPLPFAFLDNPADIQPGDAVISLGGAADAARFLGDLRGRGSPASLWLALGGDDPLVIERAQGVTPDVWGDVFYAKWVETTYNGGHTSPPAMLSSAAATYAATQATISQLLGVAAPTKTWTVQIYQLSDTGQSFPLTPGD